MRDKVYKYLKFIRFKDVVQWDLKRYLNNSIKSKYEVVALNKLINEESKKYDISDKKSHYGILGVNNQTGVFDAYIESGAKIKQKYKKMDTGWIAYNPYRVNVGSIGIKRSEHKYDYISPAYVVFSCKPSILPEYLYMTMKTPSFNKIIRDNTTGSVRQNLSFDVLKGLTVPLPSIEEQQSIVNAYNDRLSKAKRLEQNVKEVENSIEDYMLSELGIQPQGYPITESELPKASEPQVEYVVNHKQNVDAADTYLWGDEIKKEYKYLKFVRFKDLLEWGYDRINVLFLQTSTYPLIKLSSLLKVGYRGKSPVYKESKSSYILNQKCNRWNEIDLSYKKSVDDKWLSTIKKDMFTQYGDLLINSTGEGTLGRASVITKDYTNLLYDSHILLIRVNERILPKYLVLILNSKFGQDQINKYKSALATKQTELGLENLKKIQIPLPSLEVQNAIVEHINKQKSQIKELRQLAETLRKEALEKFEKEIFE